MATLLPALGFLDFYTMRYTFVADHFQYLASLGPIAVSGATLEALRNRLPRSVGLVQYEAAAGDRRHHSAHFRIAQLRVAQGRPAEAIVHYRKALAYDPDSSVVSNGLAAAQALDGRLDEAVDSYRRALAGNPRLLEAHYNLALLLAKRGKAAEAREELGAARALAVAAGATALLHNIDSHLGRLPGPTARGASR